MREKIVSRSQKLAALDSEERLARSGDRMGWVDSLGPFGESTLSRVLGGGQKVHCQLVRNRRVRPLLFREN